ncbi:hypothetical protein EHM76_02000 [bacterium]|nr:MAG: hypothetical protein EHM76_02000 [bacterium]
MARITTIPLFKDKVLSAGDSGTSDVIDLRYCSSMQRYSLHYSIAAGTSTTAGTTEFSYVGCSTETGTYKVPALSGGGTFGTSGTGKVEAFIIGLMGNLGTCSVMLTPFMKIIAQQTGAGTKGAQSIVTAELNVQ